MRSKHPIFKVGFFSNKWMILAMTFTILIQPLILYTPLNNVFHTVALPLNELVQLIVFGVIMFGFFEAFKIVVLKMEERKEKLKLMTE